MYCVTHFALGAMLGAMAPVRGVAVLAGLTSHAALDAIPHSDYRRTVQGVLDVAATCFLAACLTRGGFGPYAMWGGAAAALPDLEVAAAYLFPGAYQPLGRFRLVFPSHSGLVPHSRLPLPWGAITQLFALAMGAGALLVRSFL